jgi:hypothetical protein
MLPPRPVWRDPVKSLHDAMLDPQLFGRTFGGPTFEDWRVIAKALDGSPLKPGELAFFRAVSGRDVAPGKPTPEAYLIKPRRAGGTLFAAAVALHAALQDYRNQLGPGEFATVALIASDRKQAKQALNYVKGLIADSALIAAELSGETAEAVSFAHRVNLEVHTTSWRSTRGYSYAAVILDELAFFRDDLSANPDIELIRAVRPGLANLGGRLLGLSSPHARRGHLYDMYRQHYGQAASEVLVLKADHTQLNPTLDPKVIERAIAEDPEAAKSEWFGEFRSDISQWLPDDLIDAAVISGRTELPFSRNHGYAAFVDVSGGVSDASVLAIAHVEPGTRAKHVVLDQLIIEPAPHEPHEVIARFAAVLQRFNVRTLAGDRYGAEWPVGAFRHHHIRYEPAGLDKSAIYSEVAPLFAEKRVELLDIRRLVTELRLLERRPRSGGRGDSVDHPPRAHDDSSNACCGALWLASSTRERPQGVRIRPEYALM